MLAAVDVVSQTSTIVLAGTLEQVFPLFGPIREQEWAEGWQPRILFPDSGDIREHMVFLAESHDADHPFTATWIVSKFDPADGFIEYTVFTDARIWWISIQCDHGEQTSTTHATITYSFLGLDEQASATNERALESMFRHDLKDWEEAINHYLRTGVRLHHGHAPTSGKH